MKNNDVNNCLLTRKPIENKAKRQRRSVTVVRMTATSLQLLTFLYLSFFFVFIFPHITTRGNRCSRVTSALLAFGFYTFSTISVAANIRTWPWSALQSTGLVTSGRLPNQMRVFSILARRYFKINQFSYFSLLLSRV